MEIWNDLPRLAVGSHKRGSGKGCIMNVLSYENGDTQISDMPSCTHPVLARAAQWLNDSICTHRQGSDLLCIDCSTIMYGYEPLLIGTEAPKDDLQARRLAVTLALTTRPFVEHLWRTQDRKVCADAYDAAQGWLDGTVTEKEVNAAANGAANAANAAVGANGAANAAAYAAAYAAANAAAYAAAAANAANATNAAAAAAANAANAAAANGAANAAARQILDTVIDAYYRFMERPKPVIATEHWQDLRDLLSSNIR